MIKFSIIIPCYNVEKYIAECLDSLLIQKEQSWEAICTNDGSTDKTGEILDAYASRDSRIKVIHQENRGLSEARNVAIKVATGEWLCYLDSDDLYSPWALETFTELAQQYPDADILRTAMVKFTDGEKPQWKNLKNEAKVFDVSQKITMFGMDGYFQQMIYRRDVYGEIPFIGASWCEERPYVAKCIARSKKVVDSSIQAYTFRIRQGSITHTKMKLEHQQGMLAGTREILEMFQQSNKSVDKTVTRHFLSNWVEWQVRCIMEYLDVADREAAWCTYFASMNYAKRIQNATSWRRFTIQILSISCSKLLALLLCYLPDYLKRKGLHR